MFSQKRGSSFRKGGKGTEREEREKGACMVKVDRIQSLEPNKGSLKDGENAGGVQGRLVGGDSVETAI